MSETTTPVTERTIPVHTHAGDFHVWTEQVGAASSEHPTVLLLHGGPGATHDYLRTFSDHLPAAGIPFVYYDQLGSGRSDVPTDPTLWEIDRFVDEVEQVRRALVEAGAVGEAGLVVYGQSWGGILAIEYALAHQEHLAGLVISNMVSSIPSYNAYARDVLMPAMDPTALAEIQRMEAEGETETEAYQELLMEHHNLHHLCRLPLEEWPAHVMTGLSAINRDIYVPLQGPSELGSVGKLETWDRSADLPLITVPTLTMGAAHDTMDPAHMEWMATRFPRGRFHLSPEGSHLAMVDDEATYFEGLIGFLNTLG